MALAKWIAASGDENGAAVTDFKTRVLKLKREVKKREYKQSSVCYHLMSIITVFDPFMHFVMLEF